MSSQPPQPPEVFISYAREDEVYKDKLVKHLEFLKKAGVISLWHDRLMTPGEQWGPEIVRHLDSASIILFLLSNDFAVSDYIARVEMRRAIERHRSEEICVIPVLARSVHGWGQLPFGDIKLGALNALPDSARFTALWPNQNAEHSNFISLWPDMDAAFASIAEGIERAAKKLASKLPANRAAGNGAPRVSVPFSVPRRPPTGFVPRRDGEGGDLVERLREELQVDRNQLIALWGGGGVGKTVLAAEAAREVTGVYDRRIVWTSADNHTKFTFNTFLDEIAAQLGEVDPPRQEPEEKANRIQGLVSDAPTLIVLDQFDTIPQKEQELCIGWLAQRVHWPALVTTRDKIDAATPVRIERMSVEEARELLTRLVKLTRDPGSFDKLDPDSVIRAADCNPLVLHWVVGQIDDAQGSPQSVLRDLAQGEGDAAKRVFDRSYNSKRLGNSGRDVLLALSLFVPSATRTALAEVAGSGERGKKQFKDALKKLSDLWLLRVTDGGQRVALDFLTRELARARLAKDVRDRKFRRALVAYFAQYAESQKDSFDALEAEKDNILNAIDVAFGMKDWDSVVKLETAIGRFLDRRGYLGEALRRSEQAVEAARALKDEMTVIRLTGRLARVRLRCNQYAEAEKLYRKVVADLEKMPPTPDTRKEMANAYNNLAAAAQYQGNLSNAQPLFEKSLEIEEQLDNKEGIAITVNNLAGLAKERGDLAEAGRLYRESLRLKLELLEEGKGDLDGIAITKQELGEIEHVTGHFEEARRLYSEGLDNRKRVGNPRGIAGANISLGSLAQDQKDFREARRYYDESLKLAEKITDLNLTAAALYCLGDLSLDEGDLTAADRSLRQSLDIFKRLKIKKDIAVCLEKIGNLRVRQNNFTEAHQHLREALDLATELPDQYRIASVTHSLGLLAEKQGHKAEAAKLLGEALSMFEKPGYYRAADVRADLARVQASPPA